MRVIPQDRDLGWTPFAWLIYLAAFVLPLATRDDVPEPLGTGFRHDVRLLNRNRGLLSHHASQH